MAQNEHRSVILIDRWGDAEFESASQRPTNVTTSLPLLWREDFHFLQVAQILPIPRKESLFVTYP